MQPTLKYIFSLPPEEDVIQRNRTITTYYAQLYQKEPTLYKWAGMAAFASFHIGEKLQMWDWEESGIKSFSFTCNKNSRSLEDDFQIIRVINNIIFTEIGWVHLAFSQMDFDTFKDTLEERGKHHLIINAFEKLNTAREQLQLETKPTDSINALIWEANTEILWHEQSQVVQPLFDKLSGLFSRAMTLFAGFDYKINHHGTRRVERSRFIFFMLFKGFRVLRKNGIFPQVTDLEQRWFWILKDLLKKWKKIEANTHHVEAEIKILSEIEERNLLLH